MCGTSQSKGKVFVKDYRRVYVVNKKKCRYPKNYDDIVNSATIIEDGTDSDGDLQFRLIYGPPNKQYSHLLVQILKYEHSDRWMCVSYELTTNMDMQNLGKSFYEPFGFTSMEATKFVPVFEIEKTNDMYKLKDTHLFFEDDSFCEGGEINLKKKSRNGKLVYFTYYEERDTTFYVIRDENDKLELDKSIVSVAFVLSASILKFCGKLLTFLPIKLGECLISIKNPIAKFLGCIFFVPFKAIKFLLDVGATIGKLPVLLFVADEKKYGDSYCTLWKSEFMEYFNELGSDFSLIKNGKRPEKLCYNKFKACGTWKEFNIIEKMYNELVKKEIYNIQEKNKTKPEA